MRTLDEIFYSEFNKSMNIRRASCQFRLADLPIPSKFNGYIPTKTVVIVRGVKEEYYKKLNYGAEYKCCATLTGHVKLKKRRYLKDNTVIKDERGNVLYDEVTVQQDCVGLVSPIMIGVPRAYEPKESFKYVDMVRNGSDSTIQKSTKYIYIVPRKYVYRVNLCAFVISLNRLRNSYTTLSIVLTNGHTVYLQVVPYKPTEEFNDKPYRIISVKPSANFDKEIMYLMSEWQNCGIMFRRELTALPEPVKGVSDCALYHYASTLDMYEMYDKEKSLEITKEYEE